MKIQTKKSSKKIVILSVVAALLIAGGIVYAFREDLGLVGVSDEPTYSAPIEDEQMGENTTEQREPATEEEPTQPTDPGPDQATGPASSANEVIISSVNQDGNKLSIRTIIQPLVSGGTCTLSMSKVNQATVNQRANVQSMPSYSTCQGFDVDVSGMERGSWNLEITHTNNGQSITGRATAVVR